MALGKENDSLQINNQRLGQEVEELKETIKDMNKTMVEQQIRLEQQIEESESSEEEEEEKEGLVDFPNLVLSDHDENQIMNTGYSSDLIARVKELGRKTNALLLEEEDEEEE